MKLGLAGLGNMGRAMAERLIEIGTPPMVWNRTAARADGLAVAGQAPTPKALAEACDVILSVLANAAATEAVYSGAEGFCAADLTGKLVIEICTTSPEQMRSLAARVTAAGGAFVECPVGGSVGPARTGQLLGLAGGSEGDFARARGVLEGLTRRLEHLGPVGAGSAMKLAINLPLMVYWQALGEAVALARAEGIAGARALDILVDTSGAATAAKMRVPPIRAFLETGEGGAVTFSLANAIKDMRLMEALAQREGQASGVIQAARLQAEVAARGGFGDLDASYAGMFGRGAGKEGTE